MSNGILLEFPTGMLKGQAGTGRNDLCSKKKRRIRFWVQLEREAEQVFFGSMELKISPPADGYARNGIIHNNQVRRPEAKFR